MTKCKTPLRRRSRTGEKGDPLSPSRRKAKKEIESSSDSPNPHSLNLKNPPQMTEIAPIISCESRLLIDAAADSQNTTTLNTLTNEKQIEEVFLATVSTTENSITTVPLVTPPKSENPKSNSSPPDIGDSEIFAVVKENSSQFLQIQKDSQQLEKQVLRGDLPDKWKDIQQKIDSKMKEPDFKERVERPFSCIREQEEPPGRPCLEVDLFSWKFAPYLYNIVNLVRSFQKEEWKYKDVELRIKLGTSKAKIYVPLCSHKSSGSLFVGCAEYAPDGISRTSGGTYSNLKLDWKMVASKWVEQREKLEEIEDSHLPFLTIALAELCRFPIAFLILDALMGKIAEGKCDNFDHEQWYWTAQGGAKAFRYFIDADYDKCHEHLLEKSQNYAAKLNRKTSLTKKDQKRLISLNTEIANSEKLAENMLDTNKGIFKDLQLYNDLKVYMMEKWQGVLRV